MQIIIGAQNGETYQKEVENPNQIFGKQIGETFDGGIIGLEGYSLEITGGSDKDGFPMRENVEGTGRKRPLLSKGPGIQDIENGERKRKSVRGNTVSDEIQQLNTKVVEQGNKSIEEHFRTEQEDE